DAAGWLPGVRQARGVGATRQVCAAARMRGGEGKGSRAALALRLRAIYQSSEPLGWCHMSILLSFGSLYIYSRSASRERSSTRRAGLPPIWPQTLSVGAG